MTRARVLILNAALGPLDYRVPHGMQVEPGSIVVAPLGPRQLRRRGVGTRAHAVDATRSATTAAQPAPVYDAPPLKDSLRQLIEWTADYYLAPPAAVLRMALPSSSALEGGRTITEYRASGHRPERLTPQREQALDRSANARA
jgi:primosomal protein N' (replication factor Y)